MIRKSVERFSDEIMRQKIVTATYAFRPMSSADLALIRRWLQTPEVRRWWGDPDEQYELVSSDLTHPDMDQFIVSCDGRPFAYIQCYALSTWNQGFGAQPAKTRGIDQFIGEPDLVGRGHGSNFIRQFVEGLFQKGTPRVVTDPDPANARAVRAYEKAGFVRDRLVETPDGTALLMIRHRSGLPGSDSSLS
jgi:aminoglycoside 6'-N-acetyltransferase